MSATIVRDMPEKTAGAEVSLKVPWGFASILAVIVFAFLFLVKWYQHKYSWSVGLDAWSPEFETYWMTVLYAQMTILPTVGVVGSAYLWFSRDRNIQQLPAREELRRYYTTFGILAVLSFVLIATLGLLTEADASWHQVVIRDTDFTPTHIFLFYLGIPGGFVGLSMSWIWIHTRLPYFANRVSIPLSLAFLGFLMAGPVVAFNEWGHTFFYAEELFSSPVHWFFVVAAGNLVFLTGFVVQCLQRMRELTGKMSLTELDKAMKV